MGRLPIAAVRSWVSDAACFADVRTCPKCGSTALYYTPVSVNCHLCGSTTFVRDGDWEHEPYRLTTKA
jgi:hypothetical protein